MKSKLIVYMLKKRGDKSQFLSNLFSIIAKPALLVVISSKGKAFVSNKPHDNLDYIPMAKVSASCMKAIVPHNVVHISQINLSSSGFLKLQKNSQHFVLAKQVDFL